MPQKLPGPLRLAPSFPFAGRSRELALLRTLIPGEVESLRFALVGGEAGSGKSRLVREFAHEAAENGALVLYGACDAVVQRPYRPFVEALEQLVRTADAATLRADLGPAGGELTRLLPDLPHHVGELPAPVAAEPDTERHRLHVAGARPAAPPPPPRPPRPAASGRRPSGPSPTPSATACMWRSPTCSPPSPGARRSSWSSRTATGPTRRRCCCCATSLAAPPTRERWS